VVQGSFCTKRCGTENAGGYFQFELSYPLVE